MLNRNQLLGDEDFEPSVSRSDLLGGEYDPEAVETEIGMMGGSVPDPAEARALALRRLGIGIDPAATPNAGSVVPAAGGQAPAPDPKPVMGLGGPRREPGPIATPAAPEEHGGKLPSFGISKDADDRVSQALYSAYTRKPLDSSFFTGPKQDRYREDELAQKKSHNDFLKEQLRLKYAAKGGGALDPADHDANSVNTKAYKAYLEGSPAHASMVKRLQEGGVWDGATKAQLLPMFGEAKQLAPVVSKSYGVDAVPGQIEARGEEARKTEDSKFGHKQTLQDDAQAHDVVKTGYLETGRNQRSSDALTQKSLQFDMAMNQKQDAMAYAVSQKIPKEAKAIYDSGARIDALITKLGGPDNLEGIGLFEGSVPNPAYEKETISLRHEVNDLVNAWNHEKFGGSFTADEIKRADAAVPMIKGWRSKDEVLDGIRLIRSVMQSKTDQAVGGASPEIKRRLFKYYMSGAPDLFGPKPDVDTSEQVAEPDAAQLEELGNSPVPKQVRVPPKAARSPMPQQPGAVQTKQATGENTTGQKSPKGLDFVKTKVKNGRKYFIDATNKIVDSMVDSGL